jgi:hypothetical protein
MTSTILAGLSIIDATGLAILGTTVSMLVLGILLTLWLRGRYRAIEKDLHRGSQDGSFNQPVLRHVLANAAEAVQRRGEVNAQAIIEDCFQADLRTLLFGERFVRAGVGLVIILGLLGTFYGLTLSIGKIVHLVSAEAGAMTDVTQGVSQGLTSALSGMAVAFSNSLVGVLSAVILTILGILANVSDQRTSVMVQLETYLDRALPRAAVGGGATAATPGFGESVARLDAVVARFETALQAFARSTGDFQEFNAHLKDNVQRMSLAFGDMATTLKSTMGGPRPGPRG